MARAAGYRYRDAEEAVFTPLTERALAEQRVREGHRVVERRGRYWLQVSPGFYDGIHWLSRRRGHEIGRPAGVCWGYRAALVEEDAHRANAAMPMHLLRDVPEYCLEKVPSRHKRRELKAFAKTDIRLVHVTDAAIFRDQGYKVMMSSRERTGREGRTPSRKRYLAEMDQKAGREGWLVLAGVRDTELLGYMTCWGVESSAYMFELHVCTEAMTSDLSAALYFSCLQAFRRSGVIDEVCAGLEMPEKAGLGVFKSRLGFSLVDIPSRVWMMPPAAPVLRAWKPLKYHRLTGRRPETAR
jgi:hypothetical protein